jgi:hypothetical protein
LHPVQASFNFEMMRYMPTGTKSML